jgi:translation initiation factor IF-3
MKPTLASRTGGFLEAQHCACRYEEVRVLDKMKEMVGVMPLTQAMGMAQATGMDVILVNENAQPPLVRICSVSKYKYEIEKNKKEAQKKQRASQQEIKELKLSPRTEVHDVEVSLIKLLSSSREG